MLERLGEAMSSHDARRVASLFAEDYRSEQPVHPGRAFVGREQVLANWTSVFEGVPDFVAELRSSTVVGDTEWGEWDWRGHYADGSRFTLRGVTIMRVRDGQIVEGRLYLEPAEDAEEDIDEAVRRLYRAGEGGSSSH